MTSTFYELRERGSLFDPRVLWRFIGAGNLLPRVVANMLDAKAELDAALRTVINDFATSAAGRITDPVSTAIILKKDFEAAASIPDIQKLATAEIPVLREKVDDYISDLRIRETLVLAVQDQTVQNYETFYETWSRERRAKGEMVSKKGKGREGEVWDAETFGEWAAVVFGVQEGVLEGIGNGVERRPSDGSERYHNEGSDVGSL